MKRGTFAASVLLAVVLFAPTAQAMFHHHFAPQGPGPKAGDNGMHTAFGDLTAPMYEEYEGRPVLVEARLVLNRSNDAARLMLSFVVTNPSVRLAFLSAEQAGEALPVEVDQREQSPPGLFVRMENVTPSEPIVLRAEVEPTANGRHQVGALAIGFDEQWKPIRDADGELAQLYAYTYVGATGLSSGGGAPFQGRGNALPLWPLPVATGLVVIGLVTVGRLREARTGTRTP